MGGQQQRGGDGSDARGQERTAVGAAGGGMRAPHGRGRESWAIRRQPKLTVPIERWKLALLQHLAAQDGLSLSEYVRRKVDRWLAEIVNPVNKNTGRAEHTAGVDE